MLSLLHMTIEVMTRGNGWLYCLIDSTQRGTDDITSIQQRLGGTCVFGKSGMQEAYVFAESFDFGQGSMNIHIILFLLLRMDSELRTPTSQTMAFSCRPSLYPGIVKYQKQL